MFDNHPYWITASLPYYAFIYVDMHYGWEFGHPVKLIFLYDRMSQDIKYGLFWAKFSDASDDYSYKTYFKELGSRHLDNMVFIDDMIHFEAKNISIGIATIYRQLEKLVAEGKIQKYFKYQFYSSCRKST